MEIGFMLEDHVGRGIAIVIAITPFLVGFILISIFLYINFLRKQYTNEIKTQLSELKRYQDQVKFILDNNEMYTESDPDPYGSIYRELRRDLVLASQMLLELNELYAENRNLLKLGSKPFPRNLQGWYVIWKGFNQHLNQFNETHDQLSKIILRLERNGERLSGISSEVAQKSSHILDLIGQTKIRLDKLEDFGLADDKFLEVSEKLYEWQQTALNQIPVIFLAGEEPIEENQLDKVFIAKVYRFISIIEPEIASIVSEVSSWEADYQEIQTTIKNVSLGVKELKQITINLSQDIYLPVNWVNQVQEIEKLIDRFDELEVATPTVQDFQAFLMSVNNEKEKVSNLSKQIGRIEKCHAEVVWSIKKRQPSHRKEWVENSLNILEQAKEYNLDNWSKNIPVSEIRQQLQNLYKLDNGLSDFIKNKPILYSDIENLYINDQQANSDFLRLGPLFALYFNRLQEIKKIESDLGKDLNMYYTGLRQLGDIVSSNPGIKKRHENEIKKNILDIELLNKELSSRSKSKIEQKYKRWNRLSGKIDKTIRTIGISLDQENERSIIDLRGYVDYLQGLLALDEPVFFEVMTLLKKDSGGNNNKVFWESKIPVLEMVMHIREASKDWHRLLASINSLKEIQDPIRDRLEKLIKIRDEAVKIVKDGDLLVPDNLSWPPTTKNLIMEKKRLTKLDEEYQKLKQSKSRPVELIANLSNLADEYRSINSTLKNILTEARIERTRFDDLDKRMEKSIDLWRRNSQVHQQLLNELTQK